MITYYDRSLRLWVAFQTDKDGYQDGPCGYGPSKKSAEEDCTYQRSLMP